MKVIEFIKKEFDGWGKYEKIIFPLGLLFVVFLSFIMNDSKIALISAICGISYTVLAGKGKISCYFIGLFGTFCYAYLALKNGLYGNFALYLLYYFPMQILGIFKWKKHLKKEKQEIIKSYLSTKERWFYFIIFAIGTILCYCVLTYIKDANPIIDAITSTFSILGLLLTVKRCIEQWYVWFIVNGLSMIMWVQAYINDSNCFATVLMWGVYLILSVYFLHTWKKELELQ
jgi:nicotinamide mononucleotide transporter